MDKNIFPAGTYVVHLSCCSGVDSWGDSDIPINHIYKLREASSSFRFLIEKDMGKSTTNGWSTGNLNFNSELLLREATPEEIKMYHRGIRKTVANPIPNYQIY